MRREAKNCVTALRPQPPDFPISRAEPAYLKYGVVEDWMIVEI
jgi:hypothetical protein